MKRTKGTDIGRERAVLCGFCVEQLHVEMDDAARDVGNDGTVELFFFKKRMKIWMKLKIYKSLIASCFFFNSKTKPFNFKHRIKNYLIIYFLSGRCLLVSADVHIVTSRA